MIAARFTGALFLVLATALAAQAPLGNDAWHKVVYEHAQMRILSVEVQPGARTDEHRHDFDVLTVSMNEGTETRTTSGQQPAQRRPLRPLGSTAVTEYAGKPSSHRIENVGTRAYQLFAVENRKPSGWTTAAATTGISTTILQESRAFRTYDVKLAANGTPQSSHTHTAPTVAVLIRGKVLSDGPDAKAKEYAPAPVGLRQLDQPGQWMVIPPGDRHHLVRLGIADAHVVEIEVR